MQSIGFFQAGGVVTAGSFEETLLWAAWLPHKSTLLKAAGLLKA